MKAWLRTAHHNAFEQKSLEPIQYEIVQVISKNEHPGFRRGN
jgi:hypothetical protein